jgi:non-reducing end alpha-L-arabinofuranosidase
MQGFGSITWVALPLAAIISIGVALEKAYAAPCPCDIYKAGNTPCVAAHSTVRALYESYNGPLYQIKRTSDNQTRDIGVLTSGGFANAAAVDSFLRNTTGTIAIIYDQSERKNNLTVSLWGSAKTSPLKETPPNRVKDTVSRHIVYPLATVAGEGYRNNKTNGVATGTQAEGMYMVCSGKRYNSGCCFDYGNAESDAEAGGKTTGSMEALYFGSSCWFSPCTGSGPWFLADLEWGLFQGGPGDKGLSAANISLPYKYASGFLKGDAQTYTIRANDATQDVLKLMGSSKRPTPWVTNKLTGAIILAIGGDSSPSGMGTFYEGAMTIGRPQDTTEDAVQKNISIVYGNKVETSWYRGAAPSVSMSPIKATYNPSKGNAVIRYTLQEAGRVCVNIFDQQGRRIAPVLYGIITAGRHEAFWDTKRVPAGVYVFRVAIDGREEWAGKIIIGK